MAPRARVGGYRKTNLYATDETWAMPGTGFATFALPPPLRTVSLGICMDLNTQAPTWTRADGPYELAEYCVERKTRVLVLLNAWLDSGERGEEARDAQTLGFWAARLRPLWGRDTPAETNSEGEEDEDADAEEDAPEPNSKPNPDSELDSDSDGGHETLVVVCNRGGTENGKTFAGSSGVFRMRRGQGGSGILRAALGREDEDVLVWDSAAL